MNIIAIDTSLGVLEIASYQIKDPKKVQKLKDLPKPEYYNYIPAINQPVKIENLLPEELERISKPIDVVAINIGPGSYTSLRTGLAFLTGWALAAGDKKPEVVGVNGLEAIERISDCRAGQEERNRRVWTKKGVILREEWDKIETEKKVLRPLPKPSSHVIINEDKIAMSAIIAYIGIRKYLSGKTSNPEELRPIYNRKY